MNRIILDWSTDNSIGRRLATVIKHDATARPSGFDFLVRQDYDRYLMNEYGVKLNNHKDDQSIWFIDFLTEADLIIFKLRF